MRSTAILETIAQAKHPVEIFGDLEGRPADKTGALELKYRKLRRETHPDVNGGSMLSTKAFQNLERLKNKAAERRRPHRWPGRLASRSDLTGEL